MSTFKIFYSWQSDLPGDKTRYFIRDCIDDAITFAGESESIEAVRDEATKDTTGSPNIVTTLFSKIDECDLFVADVSLCFTGGVKKKYEKGIIKHSPNPNVLIELGYASKTLGWERIICLSNTDFGSDYPFDIAHNRRLLFSLEGKDKATVRREVAKKIFDNIKALKGQTPRVKAGESTHVIGAYDFKQKKVTGSLVALDIGKSESYQIHNEELLEESKRLETEIQSLSEKMIAAKAKVDEMRAVDASAPRTNLLSFDKLQLQKKLIHEMAEFYKESENPVVWKDIETDRERIKKYLDIDVRSDFFDLGGLKDFVQLFNQSGTTLHGTDEEKDKYYKLRELSYKLQLLEVRIQYLKTFEGMCFIPLAIQNISTTQDSNIRVVVNVEAGEVIDPEEHLICEELEGLQGMFCKDDDDDSDVGIITELFAPITDGIIHTEEELWSPTTPNMPIFTGLGFQQAEKTKEDYKLELEKLIASSKGLGYYEFDIQSLRPDECRWLSTGMLIKPVDGVIKVNYRIHSDHSSGNLSGELKWL